MNPSIDLEAAKMAFLALEAASSCSTVSTTFRSGRTATLSGCAPCSRSRSARRRRSARATGRDAQARQDHDLCRSHGAHRPGPGHDIPCGDGRMLLPSTATRRSASAITTPAGRCSTARWPRRCHSSSGKSSPTACSTRMTCGGVLNLRRYRVSEPGQQGL